MSPHKMDSAEFQVHYLGSSADLAAVKRSLEARGVVSRSRLTPGVAAVVADLSVPLDHPTLVAARELGIEVIAPSEAVDRLLAARVQWQQPTQLPVANTPLITITVLVLVGVLTLLALAGVLAGTAPAGQPTTNIQQVSDRS